MRLTEELILLMLDEQSGYLEMVPGWGRNLHARVPLALPGRALREIAMHGGAFSRGARGGTPRMQTALWPLRICPIFPADHALH